MAEPHRTSTRVVRSLYHTPSDAARGMFYTVVRAGHVEAGPESRFDRPSHPGHELIWCRSGRGWIRVGGRTFAMQPGQIAWVNCHHPHAYGADPRDPWEHWWLRFDGPKLDAVAATLSEGGNPVITSDPGPELEPAFRRLFDLMEAGTPHPADEAAMHEGVARLIAGLFAARGAQSWANSPVVPSALARVLDQMRLRFHQPLRVRELASLAGLSPSHFTRTFRRALGTSPIDWLRRERIHRAKRRLAETRDTMKEIAIQVGYGDQFFFSKDFKRMTGVTPTEFRRREQAAGQIPPAGV